MMKVDFKRFFTSLWIRENISTQYNSKKRRKHLRQSINNVKCLSSWKWKATSRAFMNCWAETSPKCQASIILRIFTFASFFDVRLEWDFYSVCFGSVTEIAVSMRSEQVMRWWSKDCKRLQSWNCKSIFLSGLGISRISRSTTTCLRPKARKTHQLVDVLYSSSSIHTSRLSYIRSVRYFPSSRVLYRFTIYFYVFSLSYRRVLQLRLYSSWTQQDKDFTSMAKHKGEFFTLFFQRRCFHSNRCLWCLKLNARA